MDNLAESSNVESDGGKLWQLIEQSLAQEEQVVNLDFYNDWINGTLYMPLWFWKKTKKKYFFFRLFSKKAVNTFCNCNQSKQTYLLWPCTNRRDNNGTSVDNVESGKHYDESHMVAIKLGTGVIKDSINMNGESIYYYAPGVEPSQYYRLFSTDIILLGSLNDCDLDGIPRLFNSLLATTYNGVPFSREEYNKCHEEDNDDIEFLTGMDTWCNSSNQSKANNGNGYFFGIGCSSVEMFNKTCINAARLCELGVNLDMEYIYNKISSNGFVTDVSQSDGLITRLELVE
jgi:hypothetical protein